MYYVLFVSSVKNVVLPFWAFDWVGQIESL